MADTVAQPAVETLTAPASAPAAHKSFLQDLEGIGSDIETGAIDIVKFISYLPKIIKAWNTLAPEVKAVMAQLFHDVLTAATDVEGVVADGKALNFSGAITLSEQTVTAIETLVADLKSGGSELVASFKVLGVDISSILAAPSPAPAPTTDPAPEPAA